MLPLNEVAKITSVDAQGLTTITIQNPLNKVSLNGMLEWSHVWIFYVDSSKVECTVCKIESVYGYNLIVSPVKPLPSSARVVDIKPYHPLESVTA